MEVLHGGAVRVGYPGRGAEVVGVVPIRLTCVFLAVGESSEIRKLRCGVRDAGVERQHEAVGVAHFAVGRDDVRHGRCQRGEIVATNLRGDALLEYL